MNNPQKDNPLRVSLEIAMVLMVYTALFTFVIAIIQNRTETRISASQKDAKLHLIHQLLPADQYNNDLLQDTLQLEAEPLLGTRSPSTAYRARKDGVPVGVVLEGGTLKGYNGQISLLVALWADGTVAGVRVVGHKETPGLGDYIDIEKSPDPAKPWIAQLSETARNAPIRWHVKKDGGDIDQVVGATITARAVTEAVGKIKHYFVTNKEHIFSPTTKSSS